MKTERELFEGWFIKTKAYKLISEMNYFKMDLFYFVEGRGEYRHSSVQIAFMVWMEFARREGFVLVPVEPTQIMCDEGFSELNTYNRDDTPYGVIKNIYQSMIEATK